MSKIAKPGNSNMTSWDKKDRFSVENPASILVRLLVVSLVIVVVCVKVSQADLFTSTC